MGILSWFGRGNAALVKNEGEPPKNPKADSKSKLELLEAPGMNGAMEVRRPDPHVEDISVFEFGSVAASVDKVTLAGYCPVSDDLEPCRWEILPASGSDAPQFRVVF